MNNQTTQLFELCDSDRKGYLTKEDLKTACPQLTSDEIVFIFSCLDTNNSGTIEKVEFCAGFEETLKQGESSGKIFKHFVQYTKVRRNDRNFR